MDIQQVNLIKNLLRNKKIDEGIKIVIKEMESINRKILLRKNDKIAKEYKQIVSFVYEAVYIQDAIKICDIIEYILLPFVESNVLNLEE